MKRFLRPIGQCLTTAVVTSTLLEAYALPISGTTQTEVTPSQIPENTYSPDSATITPDSAGSIAAPETIPPSATPVAPPQPEQVPETSDRLTPPAANPGAESGEGQSPIEAAPQTPEGITVIDLAAERQQLAEKLAELVARDRPQREAQLRENLVASALRYADNGEFDQARQTAQHPALPPDIQTTTLSKIDEIVAAYPVAPTPEPSPTATATPTVVLVQPIASSGEMLPTPGWGNPYADLGNRCTTVPLAAMPTVIVSATPQTNTTPVTIRVVPPQPAATTVQTQPSTALLTITSAAIATIRHLQQVNQPSAIGNLATTLVPSLEPPKTVLAQAELAPTESSQTSFKLDRMISSTLGESLYKVSLPVGLTIPPVLKALLGWQQPFTATLQQPLPVTQAFPQNDTLQSGEVFGNRSAGASIAAVANLLDRSIESAVGQFPASPLTTVVLTKTAAVKQLEAPSDLTLARAPALANDPCALLATDRFEPVSPLRAFNAQLAQLGVRFPLPISAAITSAFGWRIHPISGDRRFHDGVDFGAPMGTPVMAALSGQVVTANYMGGYGLTVILENDRVAQRHLYAHLSAVAVQPGTWVEQGTLVGWVGSTGNSTGPHLHFESQILTTQGWVAINPLETGSITLTHN